MAAERKYLAIDLGAESGRGVVGFFDGERLRLEEVHRFPNGPVRMSNRLYWDFPRLWSEAKSAISACAQQHGTNLRGIGVDTWGVDFGLLGRGDVLLGNPSHYRDPRTDGMLDEAFRRVPRDEIFRQTGIQFMQLNTLFQLLAMAVEKSPLLDIAETLLMMPDLFHYFLTGVKSNEFTEATTSQCYNPTLRETDEIPGGWAVPLLESLGLPTNMLGDVVAPGTVLGNLLPSVSEEVGVTDVPVIAPASHDTGAAVPGTGDDWCYISSGTWSLMGVEIKDPLISDRTLELNFTNEGGVGGTFRFLKNIMGLWLVQESRRTWEREGVTLNYDQITQMAESAPAHISVLDPDDSSFLAPGDMPARIRAFCEKTGQSIPEEKGAIVRCALESLALKYRWVIERLEEVMGRRINVVHIVGGGSQNRLLSQWAADAMNRPVVTGPVEATAAGNILVQAMARGDVGSIAEAREVVRKSFEVVTYDPHPSDQWEDAYQRFLRVDG